MTRNLGVRLFSCRRDSRPVPTQYLTALDHFRAVLLQQVIITCRKMPGHTLSLFTVSNGKTPILHHKSFNLYYRTAHEYGNGKLSSHA